MQSESAVDQITREDSSEIFLSPTASGNVQTPTRRSKSRLERVASDKNLKQTAIKIVADMRVISTKVQDILRQPKGGSERDALDDELSELHMLLGVLRRHIRGAEPMTKQQFDAVV